MKKNIVDFLNSSEMEELRKGFLDMKNSFIEEGRLLIEENPDLEKYILSLIVKAEREEEVSYRYLIYTVLDAGMGSYAPLQLAGLLDFHNRFYHESDFMKDYEYDFSHEKDYEKLNEDEKIATISFVVDKFEKEFK